MFEALAQENLLLVEDDFLDNSESFVDDSFFQLSLAIESAGNEVDEVLKLSSTVDDLQHLNEVISKFGVTQSLLAFTNRDNLLSLNMPTFAACEALGTDVSLDSPEMKAALEELEETTETVSESWFKRAWNAIVGFGEKIGEFVKHIGGKIADAARWVGGKVYNAAKAAKEFVVAHPIASVLAAVGIAAAASAIITGIWTGAIPTTAEGLGAWKTSILNKIGSGLGSTGRGIASVGKGTLKLSKDGFEAVKKGTGVALGYTEEAYKKISGGLKEAFSEGGAVPKSVAFVIKKSKELFEGLKKGGGAAYSAGRVAINWLIEITTKLWRFLAGPVVGVVMSAFNTFKGLFASKEVVDAYSTKTNYAGAALKKSQVAHT